VVLAVLGRVDEARSDAGRPLLHPGGGFETCPQSFLASTSDGPKTIAPTPAVRTTNRPMTMTARGAEERITTLYAIRRAQPTPLPRRHRAKLSN
jgi:hypothetical protein